MTLFSVYIIMYTCTVSVNVHIYCTCVTVSYLTMSTVYIIITDFYRNTL